MARSTFLSLGQVSVQAYAARREGPHRKSGASFTVACVTTVQYTRYCRASKHEAGTFRLSLDQVLGEAYTASSEAPTEKSGAPSTVACFTTLGDTVLGRVTSARTTLR